MNVNWESTSSQNFLFLKGSASRTQNPINIKKNTTYAFQNEHFPIKITTSDEKERLRFADQPAVSLKKIILG
jgi:hypothetical protein